MSTKLQETINGMGGNIEPIREEIRQAAEEVQGLINDRDKINASIGEARARVKALGINKKAFDFALKRKLMDEEERDKLDQNYSITCDALGVPLNFEQGVLDLDVEADDANEE